MHPIFLSTITIILVTLYTEILGNPFFIPAVSNQAIPPDASLMATPNFDVHIGTCPPINKNCDNLPVKYYCLSDLPCFSWQKCCLYSCNYVCVSSVGWWETAGAAATKIKDNEDTGDSSNEHEDTPIGNGAT